MWIMPLRITGRYIFMADRYRSKKQVIQDLYIDRGVPGDYREYYPWIMGKTEFHMLFGYWCYKGLPYGMCPDIEVGASLRDCRVVCRANYVEPSKSQERGLQDELEGYKQVIKTRAKKVRRIDTPVGQYEVGGALVMSFSSVREASELTNIPAKGIIDVANGRRRLSYGYVWKYTEIV
jgi:hypothetical protein